MTVESLKLAVPAPSSALILTSAGSAVSTGGQGNALINLRRQIRKVGTGWNPDTNISLFFNLRRKMCKHILSMLIKQHKRSCFHLVNNRVISGFVLSLGFFFRRKLLIL